MLGSKKNISSTLLLLVLLLSFVNKGIVFAGEEDSATSESESALVENSSSEVQNTAEAPVVQDTVNVQNSADSSILGNTDDDSVTIEPPTDLCLNIEGDQAEVPAGYHAEGDDCVEDEVVDDQKDTPPTDLCLNIEGDQAEVPAGYHAEGDDCVEDEVVQQEQLLEQPQTQDISVIQVEKPKSVYTFSLGARVITTHKKVTQQIQKQDSVSKYLSRNNSVPEIATELVDVPVYDRVNSEIDSETGAVSLSGFCGKKYFVVLVYRHEGDYSENPGSYIFNKAFECNNNAFSYSIKDLPSNLADGLYYILIGEQGETGTWSPASSLTEISLNRT